ncbi:MAG: N-6 DNA methylase, partial [Candidatus Azambacteria bacterium]|nr:N-6 DNA methylase [Candidatus Azambacteria bacterium]
MGHIFEKSINEIEKIRLTGVFDLKAADEEQPKMEKSAERKRAGTFYTPPEFTFFITHNVVAKYINERFDEIAANKGIDRAQAEKSETPKTMIAYWRECFEALKQIKVVDPACGSGAFLISAYEVFEDKYNYVIDNFINGNGGDSDGLIDKIPDFILHENLYGVDLSREAIEITQLALWLKSAREGKTLADLSKNIVCGNSLVDDPEADPLALKWQDKFPEVFDRKNPGFDCVIGNPPWERMKLQEREFFDTVSPEIAAAVNAATRRKLIANLEKSNPELNERYISAQDKAEKNLDYIRKSGRFPLNGKGDINTYAVFAELAFNIVSPYGRVGILVPSGIATDNTTKDFFSDLIDSKRLYGLYDFENKAAIFPDVHRSFKFSILLFSGLKRQSEIADFVFFAHDIEELKDKKRHIRLSRNDFKLFNPNTKTCPIFRFPKDAELTKAIYKRVPVLVDENRKEGGNPWGISFLRMFDQTNDAELFHTAEQFKSQKFKLVGNRWIKGKK